MIMAIYATILNYIMPPYWTTLCHHIELHRHAKLGTLVGPLSRQSRTVWYDRPLWSAASRITPALQSRCSFPYLALYPADMTTVGPNDSIKIVLSLWSNPSCLFHFSLRLKELLYRVHVQKANSLTGNAWNSRNEPYCAIVKLFSR